MSLQPIFDALTLEALDNFNETIPCACATPPWHCTQPATHRAVISNHHNCQPRLLCNDHSAAALRLNGRACHCCGKTIDVRVEAI